MSRVVAKARMRQASNHGFFEEERVRLAALSPAKFNREVIKLATEAYQYEQCTDSDVDAMVDELCVSLGWSSNRVLCEALLRFEADIEARERRGDGIGELLAYKELSLGEQIKRTRAHLESVADGSYARKMLKRAKRSRET